MQVYGENGKAKYGNAIGKKYRPECKASAQEVWIRLSGAKLIITYSSYKKDNFKRLYGEKLDREKVNNEQLLSGLLSSSLFCCVALYSELANCRQVKIVLLSSKLLYCKTLDIALFCGTKVYCAPFFYPQLNGKLASYKQVNFKPLSFA